MKGQRIDLSFDEMPTKWYNVQADLPEPLSPPMGPDGNPVTPDALAAIFPPAIIEQEMSQERYIEIPEAVQEAYARWRPSPVMRAIHLERALDTPAKIYYKYEGVSPAGSHKPNTSVAQAYYNAQAGVKRITTETGAGQWGSALSFAGALFGIQIRVYMVRVSYDQKPYRKFMMEAWGGECIPSPSDMTEFGRKVLAETPDNPGSLGMAISEAVEEAAGRKDTNYSLGSVLNHVCLHQSVIGLESIAQLEKVGEYPDVVIGCMGGGSNFAGIAFPFVRDNLTGGKNVEIIGVEPKSCPSVTKGEFDFDFGDVAGMVPIMKMHTLGHSFIPPTIHAGGLRYHGMSPLVSHLMNLGQMKAEAYHQNECFEAGVLFSRTEGIIPAPESTHAIKGAIEAALRAKKEGAEKTILFNLSGHGNFDLTSYHAYLNNELTDFDYPESEIQKALKDLPFRK